jgi:hypothetical protein
VRFWQITQIPHALWVDEAWFAARARDVARGINYIPIATNPDVQLGAADSPMQVYLSAAIQLVGLPMPYSSRIASSVAGVITVGVLYPALAAMWQAEFGKRRAQWMALIATAIMAGLFTHVYASRVGMQYALTPMVTVLTLWFTWKALESSRFGWAAAAGIVLGLSQYSYEAARALPILVGILWLVAIVQTTGRSAGSSLGGLKSALHHNGALLARLAVMIGFLILAVMPAALFYIRYPYVYYTHTITTTRGVLEGGLFQMLVNILTNYGRVLWGISIRGDVMVGRNLVGRPMLDTFLSIFCWLGVLVALYRARNSRASQTLLLWLVVMLLPSAVSDQAPAFNRMLPVAPALAAFVALGMAWVQHKAQQLPRPRLVQRSLGVLLAAGLAFSQAQSLYDYFVRWANNPRLFDALGMGPRRLADQALDLARTDQVYLTPASEVFAQPVYDLLLEGSPVKALDGNVCLPLVDRPTRPVDYGVMLTTDHNSLPWLKALYPAGREIGAIMHPDGYAYAVIFQVPAGAPGPTPGNPTRTEFAGGPALIGYDLSNSSARPGESIELTLYWLGTGPSAENLVSFIHIGKGRQSDPLVASHDAQICDAAYPTTRWAEGEIILDRHSLTIAEGMPGDTYEIAVGLYRASDRMRLDIVQSDRPALDNRVTVGTLTVTP